MQFFIFTLKPADTLIVADNNLFINNFMFLDILIIRRKHFCDTMRIIEIHRNVYYFSRIRALKFLYKNANKMQIQTRSLIGEDACHVCQFSPFVYGAHIHMYVLIHIEKSN